MSNKVILHLDMNSYFATLEQQAYPNLRGKPVGVAGKDESMSGGHRRTEAARNGKIDPTVSLRRAMGERTVVAGASIEAKKFGIQSGMSTWEAIRLCPEIIIIPANYDRYISTSKRIFSLIEQFGPTVDIFSIDEAFLDLGQTSWTDAITLVSQIKQLIRQRIGSWVTCSVGISYGKTLAKLASEMQKPDGLTIIRPEDFPKIAQTTPVERLCGIGRQIQPRLNQLGVETIAELSTTPKSVLVTVFGEFTGTWLHQISHGIDDGNLRSFRHLDQEKSIGHSYTLPQDLTDFGAVKKVLLLLSERVGERLRKKGLMGKTVSAYVRFEDRTGWGQRATQGEYLLDGYNIYQAGVRILELIPKPKPIRMLSITISDLVKQIEVTQPILEANQHYRQLIRAIDRINQKNGEFTVFRATLANLKRRIFNLPDDRNKRTYLPQITKVNPFTKRI